MSKSRKPINFSRREGTIIAIDPDIDKNGVATISRSKRTCRVDSLTFPEVLEYIKNASVNEEKPLTVIVEAGWLNHGNWHVTESPNGRCSPTAWAAAIGKKDGQCAAVSQKLLECFEYYKFPAIPRRPLKKCWKGRDRKITHEELVQEMETYRVIFPYKRTNQEERDSALLALVEL